MSDTQQMDTIPDLPIPRVGASQNRSDLVIGSVPLGLALTGTRALARSVADPYVQRGVMSNVVLCWKAVCAAGAPYVTGESAGYPRIR